MKTQSCLLSLVLALSGGFTAAVHAQSNAPAIRFVIAVHSEEPGGTPNTPDFRTTTPAIYDSWRRAILWFARECAARGLPWDWESEWNFLEGVKRFETAAGANYAPAFFTNTAGKNVEKYLQDDLRVELDPHSHENSGYNYADVAYLVDLALDATPSGVVGGHIYTNQGYQNRPKFTTGAGRSYQIERTTNFVNWTNVTASLITATGGTTSFTNSATAAAGFFRVRVVGP